MLKKKPARRQKKTQGGKKNLKRFQEKTQGFWLKKLNEPVAGRYTSPPKKWSKIQPALSPVNTFGGSKFGGVLLAYGMDKVFTLSFFRFMHWPRSTSSKR